MKKEVVIVGGSDVGISAALRIRELDQSLRPLIIADNKFPNFSICGIPFFLGGEVEKWQDLAHRKESDIKAAGIDLLLETRVEKIIPEENKLLAVNENGTQEIFYEQLVLGTGGINIEPPIKGLELDEVFFMRWMDDAISFDNFTKAEKPKKAVVVGGGYVGLEMAEALINRGLEVTLVEFLDSVLTTVNENFREKVKAKLEEKGVKIIVNTAVEKIEKTESGLKVLGSDGFKTEGDTVVVSVGTKPNTKLAEGTELKTNDTNGAFKVNKKLQTNIENIYAGGDCAETLNTITQEYAYYALGTVAHKHGRIIGSNICGKKVEFEGVIGTQSIKLFDLVVARTGLDEREAKKAGFEVQSTQIEAWDHKIYYPPAYRTYLKVIADEKTRKILGAQILGNIEAEISKRIDIFATAIYNEMTIEEFSQLDLSYTPPLSSPWDPVQSVVQKLELKLEE
ncbi:FAD-dependent oxidoreductase [Halanaerobium hydrogeniformans]|uniref:FAD-dependent pyridine nucleotide-disulfide oxidoreductase n=1 Tax=Halanaerobium hydrogeniformans TaxID=656519 RepID=E4RM38_HALHG|nr:FAD-dependent oxidoreductase [Halanaerobium hydrogeniformans]ADQ14121.1 FAD-dependent pyridine nucleotide-disulfide oxidoreductase [Halanaerobium hydrogeniformans]